MAGEVHNLEKSLEEQKADLSKELAGEGVGPAADGGSAPGGNDDYPLATGVLSHFMGGKLAGGVVSAMENMAPSGPSTGSHMFVGGGLKKGEKPSSLFWGGGKQERKSSPLVDPGYSEKKAALKNTTIARGRASDIFARVQISGESARSPIKGAKFTGAQMLKDAEVKKKLAFVSQEMGKAPEKGSKELMRRLNKGDDKAENFVQSNPDAIKNTTPQFQQSMAPKH